MVSALGRFLARIFAALVLLPQAIVEWRDGARECRHINRILQADIENYSKSPADAPFAAMFIFVLKKFFASEIPVATIGYSADGRNISAGDIGMAGREIPPMLIGRLVSAADMAQGQGYRVGGEKVKKIEVIFKSQRHEIYLRYKRSACQAVARGFVPGAITISRRPIDGWDIGRACDSSSPSLWRCLREIGREKNRRARERAEFAHAIKNDLATVHLSAIKSPDVRCLIDWLVKFTHSLCCQIAIGYDNTVTPVGGKSVEVGEYFGMDVHGMPATVRVIWMVKLMGDNSRKTAREKFMLDEVFSYKCNKAEHLLVITSQDHKRLPPDAMMEFAKNPFAAPMFTITKKHIEADRQR